MYERPRRVLESRETLLRASVSTADPTLECECVVLGACYKFDGLKREIIQKRVKMSRRKLEDTMEQ